MQRSSSTCYEQHISLWTLSQGSFIVMNCSDSSFAWLSVNSNQNLIHCTSQLRLFDSSRNWDRSLQLKGVFLIGTSVKKAVPTVYTAHITPHIPGLAKRFAQKTPNQDSGSPIGISTSAGTQQCKKSCNRSQTVKISTDPSYSRTWKPSFRPILTHVVTLKASKWKWVVKCTCLFESHESSRFMSISRVLDLVDYWLQ